MRIEENYRCMHFDVYTDTDSEYKILKELSNIPNNDVKNLMKLKLNSIYGKMVSNMNKDFIVVHNHKDEVGIIFKRDIAGVVKHADGTADILLRSGFTFYAINKYEDVIKQLI